VTLDVRATREGWGQGLPTIPRVKLFCMVNEQGKIECTDHASGPGRDVPRGKRDDQEKERGGVCQAFRTDKGFALQSFWGERGKKLTFKVGQHEQMKYKGLGRGRKGPSRSAFFSPPLFELLGGVKKQPPHPQICTPRRGKRSRDRGIEGGNGGGRG